MWSLSDLTKVNDTEVRRQRKRARIRFPKYGYTGNEKTGLHLRRAQTLLTFYVPPGKPSAEFLKGISRLKSERGRNRFIESYFPFPV